MEKIYIKSRIDCPPPEARQLLKEKDSIIQKQHMHIKELETTLARLKFERDLLHDSLNQIIAKNVIANSGIVSVAPTVDKLPSSSSSASSTSNSTSSLQSNHLPKADMSFNAVSIVSNAQNELIKSNHHVIQFLNDDYLQFIQKNLANATFSTSTNSCRTSLSSNTKLDSFCSSCSTTNLVVQRPTSLSSLSLATPPISSASSSSSSLKQQELEHLDLAPSHTPAAFETLNHESDELAGDSFLTTPYGSYVRVCRAARIIQLAFRQYKLRKNYFKLCEDNLKRRSFELIEATPGGDVANSTRLTKFDQLYNDYSSDTKVTRERVKQTVDLPSADFEQVVEQFNSNGKDHVYEKLSISNKNHKNVVHQGQSYASETEDYKNLDEFTSHIEPAVSHKPREEYQIDERNNLYLLKTSGRSASTSSINHLANERDIMAFNPTKQTQLTIFNNKHQIIPPVSNRSIIKNKMELANAKQECNKPAISTYNISNSPNVSHLDSPLSGILTSKTRLQSSKVLTKSPCSVNSLIPSIKQQQQQQQQRTLIEKKALKAHSNTARKINLNSEFSGSSSNFDLSKRKYLVGLNLFNRKPDKGIAYLIEENFLDRNPKRIAEFLFNRNCLSKQMIGEYISNTQDKFILQILTEFIQLINLEGLPVDEALRKFQTQFRMPGESQKIEHLINSFSLRFIECNAAECDSFFKCADETINVLAYAIILLNTSIHNPNVKPSEKMNFEQFVKMTKGIDNGDDIDKDYLHGIYERVKQTEFKPGNDHTNSVNDFEKNLVGAKKPATLFSLPHRRLVCLVQLYEIFDLTKKEKSNSHQRECFLFNDILIVTKIFSKKKNHTLYTYRCGFPLQGMNVVLFVTNHYQFGIRLIRMPEKKVLITFNARNENDQQLFCRDLAEAIAESNEMEQIRLKSELDKQSNMVSPCEHSTTKKPVNMLSKAGNQELKNMKRTDESKHADLPVESSSSTTGSKFSLRPFVTLKSKVTSSNKLLKRTLSNSMLDLSSNSMNQTCSKPCLKNDHMNNIAQSSMHRTNSECSLINSVSKEMK